MRVRDENKEKAIRKKALRIIVRDGFDGFSMQKLAKAAGVSPATIYIYFKDKEDLITQLCIEEGKKMVESTLKNFDPAMSFREGLKVQWINRAEYCLKHKDSMHFLEQIRHSPLQEKTMTIMSNYFKDIMKEFVTNAIKNGELVKVPVEVYWSVAFAPLYNLVRFHWSGSSIGGNKFTMTDEILLSTFELVLKALKP